MHSGTVPGMTGLLLPKSGLVCKSFQAMMQECFQQCGSVMCGHSKLAESEMSENKGIGGSGLSLDPLQWASVVMLVLGCSQTQVQLGSMADR